MASDPADRWPLRLESPERCERVRAFFQRAGFDEATVCRALHLNQVSELGRTDWAAAALGEIPPALRWCLTMGVRGHSVPVAESRELCGSEVLGDLEALGLLRPAHAAAGSALVCPVWLYPVAGFVVASDRTDHPDGEAFVPTGEEVFPALYGGTLRFLELLPDARGGDALDLCGGAGIGGLALARTARSVSSSDITERAAHFAAFNARLNGVALASLCGDLYAPVAGQQFDVITAHPPFVPSTGQNLIFRDGGETGEEVIRRTVEGLPAHLRAGGTALIVGVARDTADGPFEQRARAWMGAAGADLDLIFGLEKVLSVQEVVASLGERDPTFGSAAAARLRQRLQDSATRQFVHGALFVRRTAGPVAEAPLRVRLGPEGRPRDFERIFAWRQHCRQPGLEQWLATCRPRLAPHLRLAVHHTVREGKLEPAGTVFSVEGGLPYALRPDSWVVPLVARFDGSLTPTQVYAAAKAGRGLPPTFPLTAWCGLVRTMIAHDLLEVDLLD